MTLYAPTGARIRAVLEHIQAVAYIDPETATFAQFYGADAGAHATPIPEGHRRDQARFEYAGQSDVDWNSQIPLIVAGQRVFECERGQFWLENSLTEVPKDGVVL